LTLLVGWQEGHPSCKKTEWRGAGVVICLERGADLHVAQLMPLPLTVSCFSKIQIGFYLSGSASIFTSIFMLFYINIPFKLIVSEALRIAIKHESIFKKLFYCFIWLSH